MGDFEDGNGYRGVGRNLRAAREAAGKQLGEIAKSLRIGAYHLEAIEAGRYADLPEAVYVHGFVRSYAGHLNLDADEMVRRAREELLPTEQPDELHFPAAPQDAPRPGRKLLWLALILAGAVFGLYYLNSGLYLNPEPQTSSAPPAAEPGPEPQTVAPDSVPNAEPGVQDMAAINPSVEAAQEAVTELPPEAPQIPPVEELTGQNTPAKSDQVQAAVPQAEPTGQSSVPETSPDAAVSRDTTVLPPPLPLLAEPAPAAAALTPDQAEALANSPVLLRASADTWIRVSYANGATMKSWVMRPGEQYAPPQDQPGLTLMVGNAGALTVYVDGVALPQLGADGEVVRMLPLDAAGLKARLGE